MTVHRFKEFERCLNRLKMLGYFTWAAVPQASLDVGRVPVDRPVAMVFGNEKDGLEAEVVDACDGQFALPMWGFTTSFNLSVSAALSLDRHCGRYRKARGEAGDLTVEEKDELRAHWLYRSVRAAPMLLDEAARRLAGPVDDGGPSIRQSRGRR